MSVEPPAETLCKACGMCCNGQLFLWAKLRPAELDSAEALGLKVFRSDPRQRGFSQPCPLWKGTCTVYTSPHYPRVCRAYKCKLLKALIHESVSLESALEQVQETQALIAEVEALLPPSQQHGFRERLVAQIETPQPIPHPDQFKQKAEALLEVYSNRFGVTDLLAEY